MEPGFSRMNNLTVLQASQVSRFPFYKFQIANQISRVCVPMPLSNTAMKPFLEV
jgi:hypothetical protein